MIHCKLKRGGKINNEGNCDIGGDVVSFTERKTDLLSFISFGKFYVLIGQFGEGMR